MNEPKSALVVDDERDIRELLVLTLGRMGLRISTAANLAEARELLANNPYDLCLTDMRLPDGNGIELVTEIAKHYPQTPVAMITAFGSMDLAVEALKAGAFDFVSKPVDISVLRGQVHAAEGGDHRHRRTRVVVGDLTDQFDAVAVRQPHVGDAQVIRVAGQQFAGFGEVGGGADAKAHAAKGQHQQFADVAFIVDDEGAAGFVHGQGR